MTTNSKMNRSMIVAGAMTTLAVVGMGFAGAAQARDNVSWSVGVGVPGAVVNVGNVGPVYQPPVYIQQPPVYVQPPPVYYQPRPVYVQPAPVYYQPPPQVYYGRPYYHNKRHGYYGGRHGYGPGYVPAYYQRDAGNGNWQGGRR